MSHAHNEIIMPPTTDVEKAVAEIMEPFSEYGVDDARHAFWDHYVIGGRWAGAKTRAALDPDALARFERWMRDEKVMVSALRFGKQTLADSATRAKVDTKWREMFPGAGDRCVLFDHSNERGGALPGDVCKLADMPARLSAYRVVIAARWSGALAAEYMISTDMWNGVSHIETKWDGNVSGAVEMWRSELVQRALEYQEAATPKPEWLVVTVDTHR